MNQLRRLLVFFSVLVAAKCAAPQLSEEGKKILETLHIICVKQTGLDPALIEKFNTEGTTDNKALKCYMKCIMTETTVMDDDGHFDFEPLAELYSREQYEASKDQILGCGEKAGTESDFCEKAYSVALCYRAIEPNFKIM